MSKIYLKGVSKQYPDFCIKDVNLSFGNKGKVACLFGQSGSGKSTLLNLISGLVQPSSGAIIVNNRIFFDKVLDIDLGPEKRDIALIFQQPSLFPNKTIMENVKFAVKNGKDAECIADLMLKQVGMHGYKDKTPQFISGGQQQLVTLARAFAQEPSVILLDEPFSSLDAILRPNTREKVISLIKKRNLISVFVTHDPLEALEIADEIIVMEKGKIIMHDSPLNVYYRPKNLKIANLFGHVNHVPGRVEGDKFVSLWGKFNLPNNFCQNSEFYIRPEGIKIHNQTQCKEDKKNQVCVKAYVSNVRYFNNTIDILVEGSTYKLKCPIDSLPSECDILSVRMDPDYLIHIRSY